MLRVENLLPLPESNFKFLDTGLFILISFVSRIHLGLPLDEFGKRCSRDLATDGGFCVLQGVAPGAAADSESGFLSLQLQERRPPLDEVLVVVERKPVLHVGLKAFVL